MSVRDPPRVDDKRAASLASRRERAMSLPAALHFNQEIAQYSKQKMYDQACLVYEKMKESGVQPDVVTYNTMINVLVKSQRLCDAFTLFQKMKSCGIEPTIVTYTSLIDGCGKSNNIFKALSLYKHAIKANIELNLHFYNAIINAALIDENIPVIDRILSDMNRYGLEPNGVTHNTLLNGYFKMGVFSRFIDTIRAMKNNHEEFTLSVVTCLVQSVRMIKEQHEIEEFIEVFFSLKIPLQIDQSTKLVSQLIDNKRLYLAKRMLQELLNRRIEVDFSIFKDLLELAGEFANFAVIEWIQSTARSRGININIKSAELNALSKFGNVSQVKNIVLQGDLSSLSCISKISAIQCFLASNETEIANRLLDNILTMHQLNPQAADKLIQLFYEKYEIRQVIKIYQYVRKNIFTISQHSADYVIHSYVKTESIDANAIAQLRPSVQGITVLAKHISMEFVDIIPWVMMIEAIEIPPPSATVFVMMVSLLQKDLLWPAWVGFKRFVSLGVVPSENTIELALQTQRDFKSYENVSFILEAARHSGLSLSSDLCSAVIISALNSGNITEAIKRSVEPDIARVKLNKEAKALFDMNINAIEKTFPSAEIIRKEAKLRTRTRSQTCPRTPIINSWSGMEEISNRSAFLALDIDDL